MALNNLEITDESRVKYGCSDLANTAAEAADLAADAANDAAEAATDAAAAADTAAQQALLVDNDGLFYVNVEEE